MNFRKVIHNQWVLTLFCLYIFTQVAHAATYSYDMFSTSVGDSYWDKALLTMKVSISGSRADYIISKTDNGAFTSSGKMYLQPGSHEHGMPNHDMKYVYIGNYKTSLTDSNLDTYPATTFPKQMFARYESDEGGWAWVGPLTIFKNLPLSNETDYTTDLGETSTGDSTWGLGILRLRVSVVGSTAYFMVTYLGSLFIGGLVYLLNLKRLYRPAEIRKMTSAEREESF